MLALSARMLRRRLAWRLVPPARLKKESRDVRRPLAVVRPDALARAGQDGDRDPQRPEHAGHLRLPLPAPGDDAGRADPRHDGQGRQGAARARGRRRLAFGFRRGRGLSALGRPRRSDGDHRDAEVAQRRRGDPDRRGQGRRQARHAGAQAADGARMTRVVVTGVGLCTALGTGTEATWDGLVNGRSGVGPIEAFDASTLAATQAGEVRDLEPTDFAKRKTLRSMTRNDILALVGSTLALRHAGVEAVPEPERT